MNEDKVFTLCGNAADEFDNVNMWTVCEALS